MGCGGAGSSRSSLPSWAPSRGVSGILERARVLRATWLGQISDQEQQRSWPRGTCAGHQRPGCLGWRPRRVLSTVCSQHPGIRLDRRGAGPFWGGAGPPFSPSACQGQCPGCATHCRPPTTQPRCACSRPPCSPTLILDPLRQHHAGPRPSCRDLGPLCLPGPVPWDKACDLTERLPPPAEWRRVC